MGKTYSRDREKPEVWRDMKRKAPKKLKGFTLLELIVSLAIIGILSVIVIEIIGCSNDPVCAESDKKQLQKVPLKII